MGGRGTAYKRWRKDWCGRMETAGEEEDGEVTPEQQGQLTIKAARNVLNDACTFVCSDFCMDVCMYMYAWMR